MTKVLFILKQRQHGAYGTWDYSTGTTLPSGLTVSAAQVVKSLAKFGIQAKLVQVVDNNCIDREVSEYEPTHVIVEAFWVVPEKFKILRKLHPSVEWIVRNHSKNDFLSHEGGMVGWALDYFRAGVTLACNSFEATEEFRCLAEANGDNPRKVVYLPNCYSARESRSGTLSRFRESFNRKFGIVAHNPATDIRVGNFGAIRPLKNNMMQAIASIDAAEKLGKSLEFYVNATRVEGRAEPILASLRSLFERFPQHSLVEVPWLQHKEFKALSATMDIVLQVSNSETFNIVAADAVDMGVLLIGSHEIPWLPHEFRADPNNALDIAKKIVWLYKNNSEPLRDIELDALREYSEESANIWDAFLKKEYHTG